MHILCKSKLVLMNNKELEDGANSQEDKKQS